MNLRKNSHKSGAIYHVSSKCHTRKLNLKTFRRLVISVTSNFKHR